MRCTFTVITIATVVSGGLRGPARGDGGKLQAGARRVPRSGSTVSKISMRWTWGRATPRRVGCARPENHSRRHGENRQNPGLDESGGRTFHVISQPLTKRFFSFFQAVYSVQETSVHFMVLHGYRTLVDPIPSRSSRRMHRPRCITTRHAEAETDRRVPTRPCAVCGPARPRSTTGAPRPPASASGLARRSQDVHGRYRLGGRYRRMKLGVYPELSLVDARRGGPGRWSAKSPATVTRRRRAGMPVWCRPSRTWPTSTWRSTPA